MPKRPTQKSALRWFLLQLPLWSLLLLLVCVALLVVLIRFLLPHLDTARPDIEAWLNQQLPFTVQTEQLSASLYRIDPRLVVDELTLGRQGQPFLQLRQLEAEMNSWSSLLAWSPRMQEVRLQELEIWLEETEASGWQPAGWEGAREPKVQPSVPPKASQLQELLEWLELLLVQGELDFADITINLQPLDGESLQLSAPHLNYRRWSEGRQLDFQLGLEGREASSRLLVTLEGDRFDVQQSRLDAWLNLEALQAEDLHSLWPEAWQKQLGLPKGSLALEAWLRLDQGQVELELRSQEGGLELRPGRLSFHDLAVTLRGQEDQWHADWQLADVNWSDHSVKGLQGQVDYAQQDWQLLLKSLPLAEVKAALVELPQLPTWLVGLLEDLDPQGQLQNLHLRWGKEKPWQLTSQLDSVSVGAWAFAPQVENLNAWLQASAEGGQVIFQQQSLNVLFPQLFAQAFPLSGGSGAVSWLLDQGEVWVEGHQLSASLPLPDQQGEENPSRVTGDFSLQLSDQDRRLYLNLGLQATQLKAHSQLVPEKLLPEAITSWLEAALEEGQVDQGGFIFAGSVEPNSEASFQVQVDFTDSSLVFDPDWPELTQLDGWMRVDNGLVQGQVTQGKLLEAQLQQGHFSTIWQDQGQRLELEAEFHSNLNQFPDLIAKSPLQDWIPEPLHAWSYQGQGTGRLQLSVPFYDQPDDLQVSLQLDVDEGQLYLSQAEMQLDHLQGLLNFNLDQGLSGTHFTGQIWEHPFTAQIQGQKNRLTFSATPSLANVLTWLEWPAWPWAEGSAALHGEWILNPLGALQIESSLEGIALELPEPFGKAAAQQRDLGLRLGFDQDEIPLLLEVGDQLRATGHLAAFDKGIAVDLASQQVQSSDLPGSPGVNVDARLDQADLNKLWIWWQTYYAADDKTAETTANDGQANFLPAAFRQLTARILQASWQKADLGPVYVQLQHQQPAIQLEVASDPLIGQMLWETPGQPIKLNLDRIKLPAAKPRANLETLEPYVPGSRRLQRMALRPEDVLATSQPENWPDVDWSLASLERGANSLGRWQGQLRTTPQQLALTEVEGSLGASSIRGELIWQLQPLSTSSLEVQVSGNNPAPALVAVTGGKSPLVSQSHLLDGQFIWPGSPAAFALPTVAGELDLLLINGYFPETEGAALGASRLFGLMNLDHLLRRMRLDFSDVTTQGVSFDRLEASYQLEEGYLRSRAPTKLQSSATRVKLTGEIDLLEETLDQQLRVTLPVGQTLPLAAVVMGAPQVGAAIWLGQKFIGLFVDTSREAIYDVQGPINQPEVKLKQLR